MKLVKRPRQEHADERLLSWSLCAVKVPTRSTLEFRGGALSRPRPRGKPLALVSVLWEEPDFFFSNAKIEISNCTNLKAEVWRQWETTQRSACIITNALLNEVCFSYMWFQGFGSKFKRRVCAKRRRAFCCHTAALLDTSALSSSKCSAPTLISLLPQGTSFMTFWNLAGPDFDARSPPAFPDFSTA